MSKIAIIPARGGSKRIARKNIRDFCGRPIIDYTIRTTHESDLFDQIIVSTDDDEIAEISKQSGAQIPFVRPAELADDHTTTTEVIRHSINSLQLKSSDIVACIYPTAPFLLATDLQKAIDLLENNADTDFSIAAAPFNFPIQRAFTITDNKLAMCYPEHAETRSQDLQETFHDAGQFCIGKAQSWLQERSILETNIFPVVLPSFRVQDIDTEEDWLRAEMLWKSQNL